MRQHASYALVLSLGAAQAFKNAVTILVDGGLWGVGP